MQHKNFSFVSSLKLSRRLLCSVRFVFVSTFNLQRGRAFVYVPSLSINLDDIKNRITTAVNSVTQDILLRVRNEFSYRLDVTRAAEGGHIEHYKLHCEYNQM